MGESKHTEGEWFVREDGRRREVRARVGGMPGGIGLHVATAVRDEKGPDEVDANAHLIAAAPEMLEALRKCANAIQGCDHLPIGGTDAEREERRRSFRACPLCFREAEEAARAAIAKAEGREP